VKAVIAVGVIVGVVLIVAALLFFLHRRKRAQSTDFAVGGKDPIADIKTDCASASSGLAELQATNSPPIMHEPPANDATSRIMA
jgi:hypothetical protein